MDNGLFSLIWYIIPIASLNNIGIPDDWNATQWRPLNRSAQINRGQFKHLKYLKYSPLQPTFELKLILAELIALSYKESSENLVSSILEQHRMRKAFPFTARALQPLKSDLLPRLMQIAFLFSMLSTCPERFAFIQNGDSENFVLKAHRFRRKHGRTRKVGIWNSTIHLLAVLRIRASIQNRSRDAEARLPSVFEWFLTSINFEREKVGAGLAALGEVAIPIFTGYIQSRPLSNAPHLQWAFHIQRSVPGSTTGYLQLTSFSRMRLLSGAGLWTQWGIWWIIVTLLTNDHVRLVRNEL